MRALVLHVVVQICQDAVMSPFRVRRVSKLRLELANNLRMALLVDAHREQEHDQAEHNAGGRHKCTPKW